MDGQIIDFCPGSNNVVILADIVRTFYNKK